MKPGPLGPGATIGPYVVVDQLARGGMGIVFRARRAGDGALVALKVMSADGARADQVLRFQREAELAARLAHPGIVRTHAAGAGPGGLQFIAMDLVDGVPLSDRVGRLAPLEAVRVVAEVARAVEHAHAHGVIHRDLKPSNVLLRRDDGRAVVTDFGVAREVQHGQSLTRTGAMVGTPTYLAPEQLDGRAATTAIDVHALGVLLFEALTGSPPYAQESFTALLVAISEQRPVAPGTIVKGVPGAVDRLVLAALEKDPARRPTAAAFAAELEAVLASGGAAPRRAGRGVALVGAGAAAVLLLGGATLLRREDDAAAPAAVVVAPPPVTPSPSTAAPVEVPWERPPWLARLEAEGDLPSLLEAFEATGGQAEVHPRTRDRAVDALRSLDALWVEPAGFGPDDLARCDQLVFLHAVWRRLDPTHVVSSGRRDSIERHIGATTASHRDREEVEPLALAATEALPDDLHSHILYAQVASAPDPAIVRTGFDLATRGGDDQTWGLMLSHLTRALVTAARERGVDGKPHAGTIARLVTLATLTGPQAARHPTAVATTFLRAADGTSGQVALLLIEKAVLYAGETPDTWLTRARWQRRTAAARGDPALERAALESAERARSLEGGREPPDHQVVAEIAHLRADLHEAAGRHDDALAALDEGLARSSTSLQAGLTLRRAQLLATAPTVNIGGVLGGLAARLEARLQEMRVSRSPARALSTVRQALARVQALSSQSQAAVATELRELAGDDALMRALNPP